MTKLNKDSGETFVIVTHSREVGEIADRIVTMRDGLVTDDGLGGDDPRARHGCDLGPRGLPTPTLLR